MCNISAIILAAGSGSRMQSKTKKQFMELDGKPLLWYSLFAFEKSSINEVILVTGKDDISYCKEEIIKRYGFRKVKAVVAGGKERYESVSNGLREITGDIVLIHDGARPMIHQDIIDRCIEGTVKYGACVAGMPVKDTIKITDNEGVIKNTPNRNNVWITQTPQGFQSELIKNAYHNIVMDGNINITDDAMIVENFTEHSVHFVYGDYSNIKVTTPEDLLIARMLLEKEESM